jgi:hypothetical protein
VECIEAWGSAADNAENVYNNNKAGISMTVQTSGSIIKAGGDLVCHNHLERTKEEQRVEIEFIFALYSVAALQLPFSPLSLSPTWRSNVSA